MNRILPSLHYGSFEIMLTVLLRVCNFLQDINIDRFHQIKNGWNRSLNKNAKNGTGEWKRSLTKNGTRGMEPFFK